MTTYSAAGTINVENEQDWFRVSLTANTLYEVKATGLDYSFLTVYDASGQALGTLDSLGSPLGFMPSATDTYYIGINSGAGGSLGDGEGPYTLAITTVADDYRNNTTTTGQAAMLGTPNADTLSGSAGADILSGGAGNDSLIGLHGNDLLTGGNGNDTLNGGTGIDTAVYNIARAACTVTKTAAGWGVSSAADGADSLIGIERLKFLDATIALDIDGTAGQAYRVYQAAFDRTPDLGGLGFWIHAMDNGASLRQVAEGFVSSDEFKAVYGANPSSAQIVGKMYTNVLHRAGEPAGLAFWVDVLDSHRGTAADVLAGFSDSPENQAGLIGVMGNGFAYTPYG